jgi:hypothetical protein
MAHLLENMVELMLSLKNIGHFLDGGIKGFQTYHIVNYSSSIGWHVESYFLAVNQKIKSLYYGILQGQNVGSCTIANLNNPSLCVSVPLLVPLCLCPSSRPSVPLLVPLSLFSSLCPSSRPSVPLTFFLSLSLMCVECMPFVRWYLQKTEGIRYL